MAVAAETKAEVKVEKPREKTREEVFSEYTTDRQKAVQARIFHRALSGGRASICAATAAASAPWPVGR